MSYVDALLMTSRVRDRLVDLAVSENHIRDVAVSDALRRTWGAEDSVDALVSELWVEGTLPGEKSLETLTTLSERGLFPADLRAQIAANRAFPTNERLYTHQFESLRASQQPSGQKPVIVITAGTGQGKTEAFLLPILNDLYSAPARRRGGGMRALILYPMNALVTDQVERIYTWLKGQERFSVFHFTSETPEDSREANRRGEPEWEPCRVRTRQEARGRETHNGRPLLGGLLGSVPDIVITNYSMLEYMLCRPQDACFFGPDLRCIVLDEAHLYTGALAAEIAMLLRRVKDRCGLRSEHILQVATSATLGGTDDELKEYASALFSASAGTTHIFHGRAGRLDLGNIESPPSQEPTAEALASFSQVDLATLTPDGGIIDDTPENEMIPLRSIVSLLVSRQVLEQANESHPGSQARFLNMTLRQAPLVRRLADKLLLGDRRVLDIRSLAEDLFPDAEQGRARAATILLLRLSAAARCTAGEMPLIPHRLHFLVRAPEGLCVCLNSSCAGPDNTKLAGLGCLQANRDRCRHCNHLTLPLHRCHNCGEWAMAGYESRERPVLEQAYYSPSLNQQTFYLLDSPRTILSDAIVSGRETVINTLTGERLGHGANGKSLWKAPTLRERRNIQCCPACMSEWTPSSSTSPAYNEQPDCGPLVGGRPFALSVVAETVLHDLPPYQDISRNWKPAQGRRLLCFSDSRRAAARLGPLLTRQHEIALVRAAIARTARDHTSNEVTNYLRDEILRLETRLREVGESNRVLKDRIRHELDEKKTELARVTSGVPFEQFARLFGERPEIKHILNRETGETHLASSFSQMDWENNAREVQMHAEGLLSSEVDRPIKDRVHVEATGLVEVAYPGIEELRLPTSLARDIHSEDAINLLQSCWPDFIHLLLDSLRFDLCVGWSDEGANDGRLWMGKSFLTGRWATRTWNGWRAHAFVGATIGQRRRAFAANVLRSAGCPEAAIEPLSATMLEAAFDQLYGTLTLRSWLEIREHHQVNPERSDKALRLKLDKLSIKRPSLFFRCRETGTVWTRSALGWTWVDGCCGHLTRVAEDELDVDPRWGRARRELLNSEYFSEGLWGEEHSAQLSPQENRRLQELFKRGIRNILSSTTTMELGVDIGGLNGVLLGNVPPGPANHRQRAGRAGRRSDGSALVVTYARDSEYDREVFLRFERFMAKGLRKPTVFLNRARIVRRHLHAILLSEFLRPTQPGRTGTMGAFGQMGKFCGVIDLPSRWRSGPKPAWNPQAIGAADEFSDFLGSLEDDPSGMDIRFAGIAEVTPFAEIASPAGWASFVRTARNIFCGALRDWRGELAQLKDAWDEIPTNPGEQRNLEMAKASATWYQAKLLCDIPVIEWLADHRFLPRYGFPINLQRLAVRSSEREPGDSQARPSERYRLERGALLALNEYVPGSRVLVGGRIAHSRGISKHWTETNKDRALGLDELALTCNQGHVFLSHSLDSLCPTCQSPRDKYERLLFPRFGYTTASWEPMEREISFERIGESKTYPIAFAEADSAEEIRNSFGGIAGLTVKYREGAPMLIRNSGEHTYGFALCTKCGYADSEIEYGQEGVMNLPKDFDIHASIFSENRNEPCWPRRRAAQAPVIRNRVIAAREDTDMLLIQWPGATAHNQRQVFSLGRALVMAGTRLLELDHRELAMVLVPLVHPQVGIVIFDTSPGGTGHCAELLEMGREWVQAARDVLFVDEEHDRRCVKACIDCILDFSGQHIGCMLDRRSALELLDTNLHPEHVQ